MTACSSKPENLALVPKDTNLVATTNLMSLATKGKLNDLENFNLYKGMGKEVVKQSEMMTKMIEDSSPEFAIPQIFCFSEWIAILFVSPLIWQVATSLLPL